MDGYRHNANKTDLVAAFAKGFLDEANGGCAQLAAYQGPVPAAARHPQVERAWAPGVTE